MASAVMSAPVAILVLVARVVVAGMVRPAAAAAEARERVGDVVDRIGGAHASDFTCYLT